MLFYLFGLVCIFSVESTFIFSLEFVLTQSRKSGSKKYYNDHMLVKGLIERNSKIYKVKQCILLLSFGTDVGSKISWGYVIDSRDRLIEKHIQEAK